MGVVLVAYERESEQGAIEQLLMGRGHRVIRAANGLAALEAARREPPHIVVSDIVLPRMDGFALCRKWKQDERLQSIPFIFYTRRHDDPKYERFALELGAEKFIARAVQSEALLTAIDELLANVPQANDATQPLPAANSPALDEITAQHARALEHAQQTQALAIERSQQAQARLRAQLTELEATNQRLAAGEARFRRVFEANPLPMWITDHATGGFIAVNDSALAMHGYGRAEFLSLKSAALVSQQDGDEAVAGVVLHRRKDGSNVNLSVAAHEIEFDGRSADLVSAFDLTSRMADIQRAKQGAAEARERALREAADQHMQLQREAADKNEQLQQLQKVHSVLQEEARRLQTDAAAARTMMDAAAEEHRRELESQRSSLRQQEFLVDLFRQAESFDESAIVRRVIEQAVEVTNSPLAYLFFIEPGSKTFTLAAWRERSQSQTTMPDAEPRALTKGGLFSECVRTRQPTSSNDLAWKPQTDGLPDLQRYLAVPMVTGEETVALLGVANRDAGYEEDDQRALASLAEGVWRVLQSKRAHAHTLSALQRSDVAMQGMIDTLLKLSEQHDPYTAGSARRVAALAVALGREAGLDGEHQHALRVAALLHDVGNVTIPPSLLAKPAKFTEIETALMRTHVEEGRKLLADVHFGAPIAEIVYEHHERSDGSGYPRGLKGEEILIEARILAIADVVEAMCAARPHRAARGMDAAVDEINRGAGVLYDLHLATAFTRLVRQHGFMLPE